MTAEKWAMRDIDLETFKAFDNPTRQLVLRLLDSPTDRDWDSLGQHVQGKAIASWLLTLPAYAPTPYNEDDEDEVTP